MYIPLMSPAYKNQWFDALAVGVFAALSGVLQNRFFDGLTGWKEDALFLLIFWSLAMTYFHERANWSARKKLNC